MDKISCEPILLAEDNDDDVLITKRAWKKSDCLRLSGFRILYASAARACTSNPRRYHVLRIKFRNPPIFASLPAEIAAANL